jgi:hypothetical protein
LYNTIYLYFNKNLKRMIIADNKIQVAKLRLAYIVSLAMGILLLLSSFLFKLTIQEEILGIVLGAILLLVFIYLIIIKPDYIYFAVENNTKIIVRTYSAFPLFRKYKAFEIIINEFQDIELSYHFFKQIKKIRFTISKNNKVGKYPWLNLSAFSNKDIILITEKLNKILPPGKRKKI